MPKYPVLYPTADKASPIVTVSKGSCSAVCGVTTRSNGRQCPGMKSVNPKRAFKLNVAEMDAPRHMVWSDGMPLGLFKGVRTFSLTPSGEGSTVFEMVEEYSGLLAPLITKSIPDMTESFRDFAASLKQAAEAGG